MDHADAPGTHAERGWLGGGGRTAAVLGFLVFFALSGVAVALRNGRAFSAPVEQPIAFNHAKHVKELDLACSECHQAFEKEAFSGLPGADVCAGCHSEAQGKTEEEAKLVRLLQKGAPLAWKPLFRQPPHVFYSHRRHVVVAKIECPVCHGSFADSEAPPARVERLQMADCVDCHRRAGAATSCNTCHR